MGARSHGRHLRRRLFRLEEPTEPTDRARRRRRDAQDLVERIGLRTLGEFGHGKGVFPLALKGDLG
jgi:hypothetical protein